MSRLNFALLLFVLGCQASSALAAKPAKTNKLAFDTYSGYFVSNKFEPDAAESYVVLEDKPQFDKVFGAAFVMRDKSHRLAKNAFDAEIVLAAVKRGNAMVEYKLTGVSESSGAVEVSYTTTATKSDTATYACPLIVSIPKGKYKAVKFVENGKPVKELALGAGPQQNKP